MRNPRKPIAMLVLLAFLTAWVWAAVTLAGALGPMPFWAELIFYIVAGTFWVIPLRPLFRWMNAIEPPEED